MDELGSVLRSFREAGAGGRVTGVVSRQAGPNVPGHTAVGGLGLWHGSSGWGSRRRFRGTRVSGSASRVEACPPGTAWHMLLATGLFLSQLAVNGQDLAARAVPAPPHLGQWVGCTRPPGMPSAAPDKPALLGFAGGWGGVRGVASGN